MTLQYTSLRELKRDNSPLYSQTIEWVKAMDQELDGETGSEFREWIERNLNENDPPFDTFILYDSVEDIVLGTASIVPDDQCVGEQLKIPGVWLGGVNIKREDRNQGLGNILLDHLEVYLQRVADELGELRINLFARNPIAIEMYRKRGFGQLDGLVVSHAGEPNQVFSKIYLRS